MKIYYKYIPGSSQLATPCPHMDTGKSSDIRIGSGECTMSCISHVESSFKEQWVMCDRGETSISTNAASLFEL